MAGLTIDGFGALEAETAALVDCLRRSLVQIQTRHGHGSGVIWDSDGLIVTNHHVVSGNQAEVELADGRRFTAQVVARDALNDLALLRVPACGLPAAAHGDSTALRVGELILAVGNPFGVRGAATLGIVSAASGGAIGWGRAQREIVQADVELAPGNSGGPLADSSGRVVGIASMIVSPGIAVAVPTHVVNRFLAAVRQTLSRRAA
jgi:serine protease Do